MRANDNTYIHREPHTLRIGHFKPVGINYCGSVHSLTLHVPKVVICPRDSQDGRDWDYQVLSYRDDCDDPVEIGYGWKCTEEEDSADILIMLDCPTLSYPVGALLTSATTEDSDMVLVWTREGISIERDEPEDT